ncbi:MAG: hypothetical protein LAO19_19350 [Acidobacteriia bacterium]|nr:hypothetical protein [Terriglobia bacterium]
MSYDHIWKCPSLKREDWVELREKLQGLTGETLEERFQIYSEAMDKELQRYGNYKVLISMGENLSIDEVYFFLHEGDARRFFLGGPLKPGEQGYREQGYFEQGAGQGGCNRGASFGRVELHIDGKPIDRR